MRKKLFIFLITALQAAFGQECPQVAPILEGQPVWDITRRIGEVVDYQESVACLMASKVDPLLSGLDEIASNLDIVLDNFSQMQDLLSSKLEALAVCSTQHIFQPTTITQSGIYCLGQSITGDIRIAADDVELDLNNFVVNGSLWVNAQQRIRVYNGTVAASQTIDGVTVESGASGVAIEDVLVKNAQRGIYFQGTSNATVHHCTLSNNTTGMQLESASNICVHDSHAKYNMRAGFDLISSSTNIFIECRALSTGKDNSIAANNLVAGFIASDGYGNVFERCIANATQAFTTTDSNSLIAGFALRGSEGCSKIISCEAANATASDDGVAIPYGVLLEGSFSSLQSVTGDDRGPGNSGEQIMWDPTGTYVAMGGSSSSPFSIYLYDRVTNDIPRVATILSGETTVAFAWHPSGAYIAIGVDGSDARVHIYSFDRTSNQLNLVTSIDPGSQVSADLLEFAWHPNGNYLAVAGTGLSGDDFLLYAFDRVSETLSLKDTLNLSNIRSVSWSPTGLYLALGGTMTGNDFQIYSFSQATQEVTFVVDNSSVSTVETVDWAQDGRHILAIETGQINIFRFNQDETLDTVAQQSGGGAFFGAAWSPDSRYFVTGGVFFPSDNFFAYRFDVASSEIVFIDSDFTDEAYRFDWSPDGAYIAMRGTTGFADGLMRIYRGITFPQKNVIKDNTVYCNGHDVNDSDTFTGATGVGISGSSISNMIIGNTAYNNPPSSSNFFVGSNYQFVTNVFNPLFGQAPTDLQNISLNGCEPITSPDDLILLANQAKALLCSAHDNFTGLTLVEDLITNALTCQPTAISSATTITQSGSYCLRESIVGLITINADDVALDINGHVIDGGVSVAANRVVLKHGMIKNGNSGDGVLVNAGSQNITLKDLLIKNCIRGINFDSVAGGAISHCTLTQNTTGLELDNSYKIVVEHTVADANRHAGFDLISSSTNCFTECKALATGEGNEVVANNVVTGFVSADGYGNVFERCIANSTQALFTTDSGSLVANFALRGSEGCSKIIECEAANAQTSASGQTIPYGIILEGVTTDLLATKTDADWFDLTIRGMSWSPDGSLLAIGFNGSGIRIAEFNRVTQVIESLLFFDALDVNTIAWDASGLYLAYAGGFGSSNIVIMEFDRLNNQLNQKATASRSTATESLSWRFDGNFIVVGGNSSGGTRVELYAFNRATNTITSKGGVAHVSFVNSVAWHPDGLYVAVGSTTAADNIAVYPFDVATQSLGAAVASDTHGDLIQGVAWSPDGRYLAVVGDRVSGVPLRIYSFDTITESLERVVNFAYGDDLVSLSWSPDGRYIVFGTGDMAVIEDTVIISFDRATHTATQIAQRDLFVGGAGGEAPIFGLAWSPDGGCIAAGATDLAPLNFAIVNGLTFPQKNVIKDNTVYCNMTMLDTSTSIGVGISGSSISNMIIGNTSYNNPWNYVFVTNVFNELFSQAPSSLQNISLDGCTPISAPVDEGLLLKQIRHTLCNVTSTLDLFLTADLQSASAKLSDLIDCSPTNINSAQTISAVGSYRLCQDIPGLITISSDDVVVDLNNYTIDGGVAIAAGKDQVTIKNGSIKNGNSGDGILVNGGCTNITIEKVAVKAATRGIYFDNTTGATVEKVSLVQNVTGLQAENSKKIMVFDSIANCNTQAGYELVTSNTCMVYNCKALSTGEGNTNASGDESFVYGFVARDSIGNIFEQCIANSTQNLAVTDSSSRVAGFALLGTGDQCNKIIECESANAQTNASGYTTPHGIYMQYEFLGGVPTPIISTTAYTLITGEISWTPCGTYFMAVAFLGNTGFYLFKLNYQDKTVQFLQTVTSPNSVTKNTGGFSASGEFAATITGSTGDPYLTVYVFDRINERCSAVVDQIIGSTAGASDFALMKWHPQHYIIAVIGPTIGSGSNHLVVYAFNPIAYTLTLLDSANPGTIIGGNGEIQADISWSRSGKYLAVGSGISGTGLVVYSFDGSTLSSSPVATQTGSVYTHSAWWDDNLIAVIRSANLDIFSFDGSSLSLLQTTALVATGEDVVFSPDGRYVAVTQYSAGTSDGNRFRIYEYDRSANTLTLVLQNPGRGGETFVRGVGWSPDGQYAGYTNPGGSGSYLEIYNVMDFVSNNVVTNNTVYCNSNAPYGTGISGSSIQNMIIENTSYNNPFNYVFVTNEFNQLFGQGPTGLQNIGVGGCEVITTPCSAAALTKRLNFLLESLVDNLI